MKSFKQNWKGILCILGAACILAAPAVARAAYVPTPREQAYIDEQDTLTAVSIDGIAPLAYKDANGEVRGISRLVLDEVARMTGLRFEYRLYSSVEEALAQEYDLFFVTASPYAPDSMALSIPYLKSETILYLRSGLELDKLENKRYAAVRGSALPEGIKEENALYYNTREESLNAVERGEADYGYGNAYSVTFYTLHNGYQDIITVPKGKESRAYSIGVPRGNDVLLSIFNRSLDQIGEIRMQQLILDAVVYAERKVSLPMILSSYGGEIFSAAAVIIGLLLLGVAAYVRITGRLRLQNKRYEHLAALSNEYLYEYFINTDKLELSGNCKSLFETPEALRASTLALKSELSRVSCKAAATGEPFSPINSNGHSATITLPLSQGKSGVFKVVSSCIYGNYGKLTSIIGKLIDVSAEAAEKERLLLKSQMDGLTGLYNAATVKELICESIRRKGRRSTDAFLLMDCDNFKELNDTFGHLAGDSALAHIGRSLRRTFRSTDIIGRVGGDEFAVYIKGVPSAEFVQKKCRQLRELLLSPDSGSAVSVSIGVALVNEQTAYEEVFRIADDALYRIKRDGGDGSQCASH